MSHGKTEATTAAADLSEDDVVLDMRRVGKRFRHGSREMIALREVSLRVRRGQILGLIGPDGAGKTTLLRLAAGLLLPDSGEVVALRFDVARQAPGTRPRVGYMPQRFGLYEDLTVKENLDLFADLQGVPRESRPARYEELVRMTGLAPFTGRLAAKLSGGMKQKLGLACTLVQTPPLLLLDEPTVGVDPVSRRELWRIVERFVREEGTGVLLSTAYLDEAERCDAVVVLHDGEQIERGAPRDLSDAMRGRTFTATAPGMKPRALARRLSSRTSVTDAVVHGDAVRLVMDPGAAPDVEELLRGVSGAAVVPVSPRFEDSFIALLNARRPRAASSWDEPASAPHAPGRRAAAEGPAIDVQGAQRRFGDFYALKDATFSVPRGEIFGLLGGNGAGKTTLFRMLCGLLPATAGGLRVAGVDLRRAPAAARARVGYMSQRFSLYGNLSVAQNLAFFSGAYGLAGRRRTQRIAWALEKFELGPVAGSNSASLPLGYKQRLALACALMHEPDILFLDEPTSGVDPLARREFWRQINAVAAAGVTVLITTHFMEEVEYCDRAAIMAAGEILALGTPSEIKGRAATPRMPDPTMEDAFVRLIELRGEAPSNGTATVATRIAPAAGGAPAHGLKAGRSPRRAGHGGRAALVRVRGLVRKEFLQIRRDPSSLGIAFVLPAILLLLFGYGVSLDAEHVPIALVVDQASQDTAALTAAFEGSRYFRPLRMHGMYEAEQALSTGRVDAVMHLRGNFADRLRRPGGASIQVLVNGVDANHARMITGYIEGVWGRWLAKRARTVHVRPPAVPVEVQHRVWFNANLHSRRFLVPGLIVVIMTLIGAMLTALVVAREWERGTMEALLVTPLGVGELLLSKVVPYYLLGMGGLGLSVAMAVWQFGVPLRGSLWVLLGTASLFLLTALGMGLLISTLAKIQFVAAQVAVIVAYLPAFILSGFIFDIESMPPAIQTLTRFVPARYFVAILQTVFLAGDVWSIVLPNSLALAGMAFVFLGLTRWKTRKRLE